MIQALRLLEQTEGVQVLETSSIYRTAPVGGLPQRDFYNAVVKIRTSLPPKNLLKALLKIESLLGRRRRIKWEPRIIDLDILTYGKVVTKGKTLTLPHPRYHLRRFVLVPFCELAGGFIHPKLGKKNITLLSELTPHDQRVTMVGKWIKLLSDPSRKIKHKKSR